MVGAFDGKNLTNEGQRRVYSIAVSLFMNWETAMLSTSAHPAKEKDSVKFVGLVGWSHHSTFRSRDAAIR